VEWISLIAQYYPRFAFCSFLGIASAAAIHIFEINLFVRIILSIALFLSLVCLGLIIEFFHARRKKRDNQPPS
jgi:hypothetical protein